MPRFQHPLACAIMAFTLAACGDDAPPAPDPGPGGGGETINGGERLGWAQSASDAVELATFRYAIYVDGTRSEVAEASCSSAAGAFSCSGRLPAMPAGTHVLELATFVTDGSSIVESPRSSPLTVTVRGVTAGAALSARESAMLTTTDGLRLSVETIADGFEEPVDVAVAGNGRIFVAERHGRILLLEPGRETPIVAGQVEDVSAAIGAGGLLAIALDPRFDRTGHLFVLHTTAGRRGEVVSRLVRLRDVAGTLGERAVLLDDLPASPDRPAGTVRFGPDGNLYVGLDDGGRPEESARAASYNGKVLRVRPDGTTPADQRASSPVHAVDLESPRGMDWEPGTRELWVIDARAGAPHIKRIAPADPFRTGARGPAGSAVPVPADVSPAAATFYESGLIPAFERDMLVAADTALLRISIGRSPRAGALRIERLIDGAAGVARAVAIGPDGSILVASGTSMIRLRPE